MNFILAWLISSIAVFVLEMILMVVGRLIGNFFNFSFDNDLTESKSRNKLVFSIIMGIILAIM